MGNSLWCIWVLAALVLLMFLTSAWPSGNSEKNVAMRNVNRDVRGCAMFFVIVLAGIIVIGQDMEFVRAYGTYACNGIAVLAVLVSAVVTFGG